MSSDVTWEDNWNEHGDIALRFSSRSMVNPDSLPTVEVKDRAFLKVKIEAGLLSLGNCYVHV